MHSEVAESACLHFNRTCNAQQQDELRSIDPWPTFTSISWTLVIFRPFYQSSDYMDAVSYPLLIENIEIYLVSLTYPWPRKHIVCCFMITSLCLFHSFPLAFKDFKWLTARRLSFARGKKCLKNKELSTGRVFLLIFYHAKARNTQDTLVILSSISCL